ncbi:MAG TPA: TonB-dependent receptor [Pyrinomonadaceae bacterium]|nr:TonB-dependent receptor [Pyrinomonadaceae bacterium]
MFRPSSTSRACAFALLLLLHSTNVLAQDLDDVSVGGTVADERGAVVVGASITLILQATGAERTMLTDGEGRYRFVELPPGTYTARASAEGFAAAEKAGFETVAGQSVRLDFKLRPGGVSAEQTVLSEADAPTLDTTRTVVGSSVTREELERLPLSTRAPLEFVFTLGGVTEEPLSTRDAAEDRDASARSAAERAATTPEEAGTFALSGGAAYSNNVTIDGLDNNDDRAARERFQPSLEAVEEVQVITNQFSSEYGRASGGRVNLRTRGGTRQLRGRLFYFFRDEALDANTFNNRRRGLKRLPLQEHNPGFTLSGPASLSKKRFGPLGDDGRGRTFFFFLAYEYDTSLDSALIDALVPVELNTTFLLPAPTTLVGRRFEAAATPPNSPAELAPFVEHVSTPLRNHIFTARLDHTFGDTHNGTFLLQLGRQSNLRQFGGGLRLAESLQGRTRRTEAISYTDNFVFSARAVNQLRAQLSVLRPALRARASSRPVVLISINDTLSAEDPADRSGTLVAGSANSGATDRRETRFQLQDTLTFILGAQTLKLGADVQRIRSVFTDLTDATGTYSFTSAGDFLAGTPSRFRQRFGTESARENLYGGFFMQDEWRAHSKLTVSAGLRYERESVLADRDNFAPRLALAFDPTGAGRTVLRAGAGLFFNRALLRTLDDFTLGARVVEFDTNTLPAAERRPFIAAHLRFPETLTADSTLVRLFGTRQLDFSRRLDPRLRTPESFQSNFGVEREIGRGFVLEANYTFNRGKRLWREVNINAPRLPPGFKDFAEYLLSRDFANFRDARAPFTTRARRANSSASPSRLRGRKTKRPSLAWTTSACPSPFSISPARIPRRLSKRRSPRSKPCGPTRRARRSSNSSPSAGVSITASTSKRVAASRGAGKAGSPSRSAPPTRSRASLTTAWSTLRARCARATSARSERAACSTAATASSSPARSTPRAASARCDSRASCGSLPVRPSTSRSAALTGTSTT